MRLLLALVLTLLPSAAGAYRYDTRLSAKLKKEFEQRLSSAPAGRELLERLGRTKGYAGLKVLARKDDSVTFAWFDPDDNAVYLNSRFILKFFAARNFRDARIVEILWGNKEVRTELVKYVGPIYLHELTHALQCYLYPEYRQDAGANPLEFEYEAYLTEDMYVHEQMKKDPALLRAFIRGTYTDLYTANVFGSYFTLSLDPARYREKIRRMYEERIGGYVSMEKAAVKKRNNLADSRIFALANGQTGTYDKDTAALDRLQKEKAEYAKFLDGFYKERWPAFSADALLFVGGLALKEKNYPLALDCLAVADANSAQAGLAPEALESLKTKGALAVLEASSFVRDARGKMDIEVLSQHLKALERACAATGRPFPDDLKALAGETYPKAMAFYARRHAAEKDPSRKEYYKENLDYFAGKAESGPAAP